MTIVICGVWLDQFILRLRSMIAVLALLYRRIAVVTFVCICGERHSKHGSMHSRGEFHADSVRGDGRIEQIWLWNNNRLPTHSLKQDNKIWSDCLSFCLSFCLSVCSLLSRLTHLHDSSARLPEMRRIAIETTWWTHPWSCITFYKANVISVACAMKDNNQQPR